MMLRGDWEANFHSMIDEAASAKIRIPAATVFYSEIVLGNYSDIMQWILSLGEECRKLNPNLRCAEPEYEFCEYPDGEYKEHDIQIRHNQAVTARGVENDVIKFREIPETKVLSIYHKGAYDSNGEVYAFIINNAEENVCRQAVTAK